jgi:hypothetical protein
VTDYAGWCVVSLDFVHVLNTHWLTQNDSF